MGKGEALTVERMKILGEFWDNGIAAEIQYNEKPKPPNEQIKFALDNKIPLVLWIGESEIAEGKVKIKELNTKDETFIERA